MSLTTMLATINSTIASSNRSSSYCYLQQWREMHSILGTKLYALENIQTNTDKRVEIFNVWQRQSKSKWPQINLPQHMPHNKHAAAQSLLQQFATLSDTATKDSEHFQHNTQQPTFQFIVTGNLKKKKKQSNWKGCKIEYRHCMWYF
ncbi:unnamed protein product [Ceratitis capitata]|uniref:(Mediterranean fruit fly) hypothetical protein n=1 Tax=Ceratitis capitata TaxID=7213 RepID=A0A811VJC5_CERCA|nr:unnamed protein product [Ceratitis capitata]